VTAVLGTIFGILIITSLSVQVSGGVGVGERVSSGAFTVVAACGVLVCKRAWAEGGFRRLLDDPRLRLGQPAAERFFSLLHSVTAALKSFGYALAAGTVFAVIVAGDSEPIPAFVWYMALFSLACYLLGLASSGALRRKPITVRVRIKDLGNALAEVKKKTEAARASLAVADSSIDEIDRDLAIKYSALTDRQRLNTALTNELEANPTAVAAYTESVRRGNRQTLRHQWLGVAVGVAATLLLGYLVNVTTPDVWAWITNLTSR
jgi:hypothetical protein